MFQHRLEQNWAIIRSVREVLAFVINTERQALTRSFADYRPISYARFMEHFLFGADYYVIFLCVKCLPSRMATAFAGIFKAVKSQDFVNVFVINDGVY